VDTGASVQLKSQRSHHPLGYKYQELISYWLIQKGLYGFRRPQSPAVCLPTDQYKPRRSARPKGLLVSIPQQPCFRLGTLYPTFLRASIQPAQQLHNKRRTPFPRASAQISALTLIGQFGVMWKPPKQEVQVSSSSPHGLRVRSDLKENQNNVTLWEGKHGK
jgi:hypothetical protein